METISIKDESGKVYEFEKPEFNFKFNSLTIVNDCLIGYGWINLGLTPIMIRLSDNMVIHKDGSFNIKPIKPKWYEDEKNFPALMVDYHGELYIQRSIRHSIIIDNRLATKEEVLSLYYEGKGN